MAKLSFSEKLKKIAKKQLKEVDASCCQIARDTFHLIVDKTPVGLPEYPNGKYNPKPGELVNNWQSAVNTISMALQQRPGPSKTGAHKRIDTTIINGSFMKDGFVSFTNSTSYVNLAENIGWPAPMWTGKTGPYMMIKNSVADIISKYKFH